MLGNLGCVTRHRVSCGLLTAVIAVLSLTTAPPLFAQSAAPRPTENSSASERAGLAQASYVPNRVARGKNWTDFEAMMRELAQADVVYLGEQHDDRGTHALQLAVLEGLARRGVSVVLSLEMIERDAQAVLDAYLRGSIPETAFLEQSRPWPNYQPDYRPLVEFAKAQRWPVIASNVPRNVASSVSRGGLVALDTLTSPASSWVATERSCAAGDSYAKKFGKTMEDMGGHGGPAMTPATISRFYEAQCVKDETMAESVAKALDAHPNAVVVHVAGGFHVEEGLGTVERVDRRRKSGAISRNVDASRVVMFVPTADLDALEKGKDRKLGDFVVYPLALPSAAPAATPPASAVPSPTAAPAPAAQPVPSPATDARATTLMRRLEALAHDSMEGRGAGTPGGARGRRYIVNELRALGVAPAGEQYEQVVRVRARPGADTLGANVVARIKGTRGSGPVIVVSAHHDHLGIRNDSIYNGADDDASGSVALLSLAESILKTPLAHDVVFAWFDAEESGMLGSRAFVESPPVPRERIAFNLNLDMVSRQEGGALWAAGTSHYPLLLPIFKPLSDASSVPIRFGHDTPGGKPSDNWTNSSDHASFHRAGIPFIYLGVEDHPDYHKPGDDANKVDPTFFSGTVGFAERLLRAADAQLDAIARMRTGTP